MDALLGTKGIPSKTDGKRNDISSSPLKVKAILISDHVRLALIDRHIVTVGDSIHDEKILEIRTDRVILGKGDQKRTLLLSQSPVPLTVEERKGDKK
jgi:predicted mannosyl-3-phosphoglycerate phosphatase (HAD superfamily)